LHFVSFFFGCTVNHYAGFDWDGLKEQGVQDAYEALGWIELCWEEGKDPNRNSVSWDSLTDTEQKAAEEIYYTEELWDKIPLDQWEQNKGDCSPNNPQSPSSSPTSSPRCNGSPTLIPAPMEPTNSPSNPSIDPLFDTDISFPSFRYLPWSGLSESTRLAATNLGYTPK
jgi:hypothetical protein